ncbi:uncharacterized protein [Parasteatoda tepidariorum]|uniref:uncharacterized protein n=1 Tax=Parasteatoda tepidariorum TaxID=114398 RepID=UPI00077FC451|nr:uncharacterized protein LOC107453468 isoform X2 [Parasteatoda tepidariorum]XP_015925803.1 uncharacterized protein LOC107453468 isoform X2 [Parasteatoda tepidariorum]XP_042902640.1 uncharacterized protein LOC107453468 isoform X2 [Parasteatoda tepidariorum]XP_042902641.1 uncharacterized protein LOC107453468 isoform X2 [Parasteatoda tepidariorum]
MSFMSWKKGKGENREEHTEDGYFINYTSEPPTLLHIAAVSIASRLWSEPDIKEDIKQYSEINGFYSRARAAEKVYEEYEKRVLQKLADMLLPDKLKCKVSENFRPIGLQLFKGFAKEIEETFENDYKEYCRFYDIFKMGGSVYWTMEGIIDNVTSLKELINNDDQEKDFYCLYELACKYCLEECVLYIWGMISPDKKNEVDSIYENYDYENDDYHIIAYWTALIENKLRDFLEKLKQNDVFNFYDNSLSIEQNMVSLSIFVKNPYSLKYFWNKLKENERNVNLEKWLNLAVRQFPEWGRHEYQSCNDKTNSLCFLLSQLNDKNQQKEVFEAHSEVILRALFYNWPWQRFFLPAFCIMLEYVSEETFVEMMSLISNEIREENEIIIEVFKEIWFKSPLKLKKSLIQFLEESTKIIYRFIDMDDVETIFMILKYATEEESKQILFKMIESYALFSTLRSNKLSLIDTLMTKYLTSSDDIEHFKYSVMVEHGNDLCKAWIDENDFQAVETLIAWSLKTTEDVRLFKEEILDKNKIYCSLVCLGDYQVVDRFMNWCFESADDIKKFKKAFIHEVDEDNSSICSHLLWELSVCNQGWENFEKFVNYNFCSPEEVTEFKNLFLESVPSFLDSYRFEFAHNFVMWCLGSIDEVNQFKNSFSTSEKGMKIVVRAVNKGYPVFYHPNELIKWLSMSKETTAELKCKLDNNERFFYNCSVTVADYKRWALFYMLDKHDGGDKTEYKEDSDSIDKDNDITIEIMKAFKNRQ